LLGQDGGYGGTNQDGDGPRVAIIHEWLAPLLLPLTVVVMNLRRPYTGNVRPSIA
jgi:hypothetical protein